MKLSALTCIYDKPPEVEQAVIEALSQADEIVAVFDRPKKVLPLTWCVEELAVKTTMLRLDGPPGWRSPCLSWNAGLKQVTGDQLIIVQGDVVLSPGSIQKARELLEEHPAVYFGKVTESNPEICTGAGHAGPILCSSRNPRPLTYLVALPTAAVKAIGGWDESFQAGVWYEDDDFTARLWQHGLDFVFTDEISGIHQSHARAYAMPINIAPNMALFLEKYGTPKFFDREIRQNRIRVTKTPGRTEWSRQ